MPRRTQVSFTVEHHFANEAEVVWREMVDWNRHADWIPMTRVKVDPGDPTAVGATFTAWTGIGPLSLEDRMRVSRCDWDPDARVGTCGVEKLGPVLTGTAGFTIAAAAAPQGRATLRWVEDVEVRFAPRFLGPVLTKIGAVGFRSGMRRLAKKLAVQTP